MMDAQAERLSCLASNHIWRRQAANLHHHAELSHLSDKARATLRREAAAADRQAGMWLDGAIEAR